MHIPNLYFFISVSEKKMDEATKSVNTQLLKHRVAEGNIEAVKNLLPKSGNIDEQYESGWTILHLAVAKGEEEMVNTFLEANADPNICSNVCTSPLMTAFNKGHFKVFEQLIQGGANVNYQDQESWSVLFSACLSGNEEIVDILLNANADPNLCAEDGKSPLIMASQIGHASIIKKLILAEADINKEDSKGQTAFEIAMAYGMDEAVEVLPLPEAFKGLLELNKNLDDVSEESLQWLKNLKHVTNNYISPKIIKVLVQKGVEVNYQLGGKTALFYAIEKNNVAMVNALLENGADANICDNDMDRPLIFAAKKGYLHLVKNLLDNGADINVRKKDGMTALFCAVYDNKEAQVDFLLRKKADPNISRNDMKTPLMEACDDGNTSLVKKLLLYGANVNLKDAEGKTAYDWARDNDVKRMLEDAKQAKSMTGIGLEPQLVEHLSMVGAFLEQKDENVDVAQLNEQLAKMIRDLQSFQALLTGEDGTIESAAPFPAITTQESDSENHNQEQLFYPGHSGDSDSDSVHSIHSDNV